MNWQFFFFETVVQSELEFNVLRKYFIKNIGVRYHKGNVERDFVSLFYTRFGWNIFGLSIHTTPSIQIVLDLEKRKNDKQEIKFTRALHGKIAIYFTFTLISVVISLASQAIVYGLLFGFIFYLGALLAYYYELSHFKSEIIALQSIHNK